MRLYFRPIPRLTVAVALAFVLLMGLGIWQVERLHWKLALIAQVNSNLAAQPLTPDRALAMGSEAQYHRVALNGRFDNKNETYVFTTGPDGQAVYHVLTPFRLADGRTLMVDRGYIPLALRDPGTRKAGELGGVEIVGVWRMPDAPGPFTPAPDLKKQVWYARDVTAMAKVERIALAAPVIVEADATANPGGWPKGGQTVVRFRNQHLQYAITWFALAGGLLIVYLAYHRAQGRLGFR